MTTVFRSCHREVWCDAASCTSIRLFLLFPISCPNLCRTLQSSGLRSDVERRTQFSLLLNVKIAIQASRHWSHGFFVVSLVWVVCRYYYECWTIQPREILILFKVTARFVWSRVTLTFRVEVWKDSIKQKILPCLWTFEASSTIEANSEVCLFATKSQINSPYISDKLSSGQPLSELSTHQRIRFLIFSPTLNSVTLP